MRQSNETSHYKMYISFGYDILYRKFTANVNFSLYYSLLEVTRWWFHSFVQVTSCVLVLTVVCSLKSRLKIVAFMEPPCCCCWKQKHTRRIKSCFQTDSLPILRAYKIWSLSVFVMRKFESVQYCKCQQIEIKRLILVEGSLATS